MCFPLGGALLILGGSAFEVLIIQKSYFRTMGVNVLEYSKLIIKKFFFTKQNCF